MSPQRSLQRNPGWGWLVFVATVAVLLAAGFTVVYVSRTVQQLCGIIGLQADADPPPQTERGRALLHEAQRLEREYHCD